MTLLGAVQSLSIVELAAVSWINIRPADRQHVAVFTMALLLPFGDPALSKEFHPRQPRFWPDQRRLLDDQIPIQDQILELDASRILGKLASVYLAPIEGDVDEMWIVETHAGSREERNGWLKSLIALEGRAPTDEFSLK